MLNTTGSLTKADEFKYGYKFKDPEKTICGHFNKALGE